MKLSFLINSVFFTFGMALTACGGAQSASHTPVVSVEPQFQTAVAAFQTEAANQGAPVTITDLIVQSVTTVTSEALGDCILDPSGANSPTIQISQSIWDSLDADGQQELLFHELGHCVLGRAHRSDENNGAPLSIMSPAFFGSTLYDANKAQYLHELFTNVDTPSALPMVVPPGTLLPDL